MNTPVVRSAHDRPPIPAAPELRERDERLEALNALCVHLAHDFNNYLAPILGYVTLIKEELAAGSAAVGYANSLEQAARHTESILDTVLLSTRPMRRFQPEKTDLTGLIEEEMTQWLTGLSTTARIEPRVRLAPCVIMLDAGQWRTVIQQLLRNARFGLAMGGALEVSLQPGMLAPQRATDLGVVGTDVFELTVRDTGLGMSEAVLKRAFDPFFSTRPKGRATGLGLTFVHGVTRLHGGQVTLESAEDEGTTVRLWIPVVEYRSEAGGERPPAAMAPSRRAGNDILLADEDPVIRDVLKACLQKARFHVHLASDGVEGLKLFKKHAPKLALVISDVTMPNLNGPEFVRQVLQVRPDLPVLMISGDADDQLAESLATLGCQAPRLLKKPFALKTLLSEVQRLVG